MTALDARHPARTGGVERVRSDWSPHQRRRPGISRLDRGIVVGAREIAPFDPAISMGDRDFNAVGLVSFHDEDQLQQILANLKSAHLRAMTKTMRRAQLAS